MEYSCTCFLLGNYWSLKSLYLILLYILFLILVDIEVTRTIFHFLYLFSIYLFIYFWCVFICITKKCEYILKVDIKICTCINILYKFSKKKKQKRKTCKNIEIFVICSS